MKNIGYTHGRYQPLHNGHLHIMINILNEYNLLYIGIANPLLKWPCLLKKENPEIYSKELFQSIKKARDPINNPFTYLERYKMIEDSLIKEGIDHSRFKILPHFGFYDLKHWDQFIPQPSEARIILAQKDYHHYEKIKKYKKMGWSIDYKSLLEGVSGELFDQNFPNGNWQELVPKGSVKHINRLIK